MAKKRFVWDNFTGGLSPSSFRGAKGQYANGTSVYPLMPDATLPDTKGDYILFVEKLTEIGTTDVDQSNAITGFVVDPTNSNDMYAWAPAVGELYKISGVSGAPTITKPVDTGVTEDSGLAYYNGGIFYAKRSGNDVGRYDISGASNDVDYMSTIPSGGAQQNDTSGIPHPMHVHIDNQLYIGDGRWVNKLNQNDGTEVGIYTNKALDLPIDQQIACFESYEEILVIGTNSKNASSGVMRKGTPTVFFWDTFNDSYTSAVPVNVGQLMSLKYSNGYLVAFGNRGEILVYNGRSFDMIQRLQNFDAPIIGQHGVCVANNGLLVYGGTNIYYIDTDKNFSIHPTHTTPSKTSTQGAIAVRLGSTTLDQIYAATDLGLFQTDTSNTVYNGAYIQSIYYTSPRNIKIEGAHVYFTGGACPASNYSATLSVVDFAGNTNTVGAVSSTNHGGKQYIHFDGTKAGSSALNFIMHGGFAVKYTAGTITSQNPVKMIVIDFTEVDEY